MRRLRKIFLALFWLAAGLGAAKLIVPPRQIWQTPKMSNSAEHAELPTTVFRVGDLLEREQLPTIDSEISGIEHESPFTRYSDRRGELMQMIEAKIDPDSWMDNGAQGPIRGRIHGAGDVLVVTQTRANTKAIDAFLESLRYGGTAKNAKTANAPLGN